jgi:hypothetical protein
MMHITVYSEQDLERAIRDCSKIREWHVIRFNGYSFKVYGKWAQIMENPQGLRASGDMGHKTQKALIAEIQRFIYASQK